MALNAMDAHVVDPVPTALSGSGNAEVGDARLDLRLVATLSLLAGLVDVTSWLVFAGLFASHITGNLVVVTANLTRGELPSLGQLLAIPVFSATVAISSRFAGPRLKIGTLLGVQCALLMSTAVCVTVISAVPKPLNAAATLAAMFAVAAMAVQNALVHLARGGAPSTAVMTGNLVVATLALMDMMGWSLGSRQRNASTALRADASKRWHSSWPLVGCFVVGCALGAVSVMLFGAAAWYLPASIALLVYLAVRQHSKQLAAQ